MVFPEESKQGETGQIFTHIPPNSDVPRHIKIIGLFLIMEGIVSVVAGIFLSLITYAAFPRYFMGNTIFNFGFALFIISVISGSIIYRVGMNKAENFLL